MCQFGCGCYQTNPAHWTQFDHPAEHENLAGSKRKQSEVPISDAASDRAQRRDSRPYAYNNPLYNFSLDHYKFPQV